MARRKRGVLHPFPRGNQWWVQVPGVGRRSLGVPVDGTSKEEAYRLAAQRFAAGALDHKAALAARETDLAALAKLYVTENAHRWSARHAANVSYRLGAFVTTIGVDRIDQITAATLATYAASRPATHAKKNPKRGALTDAAINRTVQIARAMARWAAKRSPPLCELGALATWKNLKEIARNRDPLIPSPAEWSQVVRAIESTPDRVGPKIAARVRANARGLAIFVALAVQTGLRFDELRHLRAVDVGEDVVRVQAYDGWRPKDREERDVPVPASVAGLAREMIAWRDVARGINGKRLVLGDHWVIERLAAAWTRAGLPGDPPGMHDCRRTFATEMSRTPGVSIRDVQRLLGHADLTTTQRYLGRYRSDAARPALDLGFAAMLARPDLAAVIPLRRGG